MIFFMLQFLLGLSRWRLPERSSLLRLPLGSAFRRACGLIDPRPEGGLGRGGAGQAGRGGHSLRGHDRQDLEVEGGHSQDADS